MRPNMGKDSHLFRGGFHPAGSTSRIAFAADTSLPGKSTAAWSRTGKTLFPQGFSFPRPPSFPCSPAASCLFLASSAECGSIAGRIGSWPPLSVTWWDIFHNRRTSAAAPIRCTKAGRLPGPCAPSSGILSVGSFKFPAYFGTSSPGLCNPPRWEENAPFALKSAFPRRLPETGHRQGSGGLSGGSRWRRSFRNLL